MMPIPVAIALTLLCLTIIYMDLRYMRIPDRITIALIAVFCVWAALAYPSVPVIARLGVAGVVFAICFGLFAARIMGGGDTKVIPALALFVPLDHLSWIMMLFAVCLFLSIGLVLLLRKSFAAGSGGWSILASHKLPMGVAIGTTGIFAIAAGQL